LGKQQIQIRWSEFSGEKKIDLGAAKKSTWRIKHGENLHIASWTVGQLSGKKLDPPGPKFRLFLPILGLIY
jgi:hypothetical protein